MSGLQTDSSYPFGERVGAINSNDHVTAGLLHVCKWRTNAITLPHAWHLNDTVSKRVRLSGKLEYGFEGQEASITHAMRETETGLPGDALGILLVFIQPHCCQEVVAVTAARCQK